MNNIHFHKNFNQEFRDENLLFDIRFSRWYVFHIVNFNKCVKCLVRIYQYCIRVAWIFWNIIRFFLCLNDVCCSCRRNILFNWINRDHYRSISISFSVLTSLWRIDFKISMILFVLNVFIWFIIFFIFFQIRYFIRNFLWQCDFFFNILQMNITFLIVFSRFVWCWNWFLSWKQKFYLMLFYLKLAVMFQSENNIQ